MASKDIVIAIVGPTGTGKTALGVSIATHLDSEVISVDSLQCYKDGHIITAAPTAVETAQVKHHMVSYLWPDSEPGEEFVLRAVEVIEGLHAKDKVPVLVGGSTSLMLPLLFATTDGPENEGGSSLGTLRWQTLLIVVNAKTQESLEERLDARVDEMLAMGLVKELQGLYSLQKKLLPGYDGTHISRGVWKCIGYNELYPFLVAEETGLRITHSTSIRRLGSGNRKSLLEELEEMEEETEGTENTTRVIPASAFLSHPGNGNGKKPMAVTEGYQAERLLREGVELMKESTRSYAQWQIIWGESVLVPAIRKEGMPVHRFEIPFSICVKQGEKDRAFKNEWVKSVEVPALKLCDAWTHVTRGHQIGPAGVENEVENRQNGNADWDIIRYFQDTFLSAGSSRVYDVLTS